MATSDESLRKHLIWLLEVGNAHVTFDKAFADLPPNLRGAKIQGVAHTPWRLLEHMRICQWDLVEYCLDPSGHQSPQFPEGYWPKDDAPPTDRAWDESIAAFKQDLRRMVEIISDSKRDLTAPLPGTPGHTILREVLILADHNAYHLGQVIVLRKALGAWNGDG